MEKKENKNIDKILLVVVSALIFTGLVMIYTSSSIIAYEIYGDSAYFLKKQVLWLVISIFFAVLVFNIKEEKMIKMIPIFLWISIILLLLTNFPFLAKKIGGAKRWLKLPFLPAFQPFEFVKLFLILYLAYLFSNENISEGKKIIKVSMITTIIFINLILQPDMGGAMIILILTIIMMIISKDLLKYVVLSLPFLGMITYFLIKVEPYRLKRLLTFLDPWQDPYGVGYQTIQSLIGIGSGGIFGIGLSQSQQKFFFLPTPHTDYIFSIIGEEFGFLGCFFILFMFFIILWRGFHISINLEDKFQKFLAAGLTSMLIVQASINICVAVGLLPPKGTTLPFISFGGSSLIVSVMSVSILLLLSSKIFDKGKR